MTFVNGELQAQFMARIRGLDPQGCLVIPVDVGKSIAMALVADHYGEIIVAPFEFALTETGFQVFSATITRAQHVRDALVIRVGVEAAGHYHRTLVARLRAAGLEVVELNPRTVKDARGQQLLRTLKNDAPDCGAGRTVDPRHRAPTTMPRRGPGRPSRLGRAPTPQGYRPSHPGQQDPRAARSDLPGTDRLLSRTVWTHRRCGY